MLKCKECGNTKSFTANGTFSYVVEDELDGEGKIVDLGTQSYEGCTEYMEINCNECGVETEDIEGAEEWLKKHK